MPRIWLTAASPSSASWVQTALEAQFDAADITLIVTRQDWKKALKGEKPPHLLIIAGTQLPWESVEDFLRFVRRLQITAPTLWISDHISEGKIARLLDRSLLTAHLPNTPPQPLLLAARVRQLLAASSSAQNALNRIRQLSPKLLFSDDPYVIASQAITRLASAVHAVWGSSVLLPLQNTKGKVLSVYHPIGQCPQAPRQTCSTDNLPPIPTLSQWLFYATSELPNIPLRADLQQENICWLGIYHLAIGPELHGLLMLGWHDKADVPFNTIDSVTTTVHWLSAVIYRAIKLHEKQHSLRQAQVLTNLVLSLNRSLDADTIFQRLLEGLRALVPYEQASVWEWTEEGDLVVRHILGYAISPEEFNRTMAQSERPPREWATTTIITETKRPLLISDVKAFPAWHPISFTEQVRCWLGVPLVYNEKVIGVLGLDASEPGRFTEEHLQMAQTLSSAATIALQNARLYEHEHRRHEELNALRVASLQLVSSLDITEVLNSLLEATLQLVNAGGAHIFLYDGEKISFAAAIWEGKIRKRPISEPRPDGITYRVARTGQIYLAPNIREDPLFRGTPWKGAILSLPLIAHGKIHGVMNVAWDHPREFPESEITLLHMLADYAAIALENANLVQALQNKIQQLSVLASASAALREAGTPREIAQALAEQAIRLGKAQSALVARFIDETYQRAIIEHVIGMDTSLIGRFFSTRSGGLTHYVQHLNRLVTFRNLSQSPIPQHPEWLRRIGPAVAIPLHTRSGEMVGLLLVGRPLGSPPFAEEEITPLDALAEIGATAFQRANATTQLEEAFLEAVLALSQAIDARDTYHGGHSRQMAEWASAIAQEMGLPPEEIETVRLAAMLHDVGKIGIPDEILLKPGPLTEHEWEVMRAHPAIGAKILRPLKQLDPVAKIVEAHHERWDGSGYPRGLKGEEIPLGARILAVADSYGAMVDDRVYHRARSHEEAAAEIRRQAGKLYDPAVVDAFLRIVEYLTHPSERPASPKNARPRASQSPHASS